jgi:hypothetical protein
MDGYAVGDGRIPANDCSDRSGSYERKLCEDEDENHSPAAPRSALEGRGGVSGHA